MACDEDCFNCVFEDCVVDVVKKKRYRQRRVGKIGLFTGKNIIALTERGYLNIIAII